MHLHLHNYELFHTDVRANANARIAAHLAAPWNTEQFDRSRDIADLGRIASPSIYSVE